jgi:hypothetical protein
VEIAFARSGPTDFFGNEPEVPPEEGRTPLAATSEVEALVDGTPEVEPPVSATPEVEAQQIDAVTPPAASPPAQPPATDRPRTRRSFMFARVDDAARARDAGAARPARAIELGGQPPLTPASEPASVPSIGGDLLAAPRPLAQPPVTLTVEPVSVPSVGDDLEVVAVRTADAPRAPEASLERARASLDARGASAGWIEMLESALRACASWLRTLWPW